VLLGLENIKMAAVAMVTMQVVFLNCPIVMKLHRNYHWDVQMCIQAGFACETL
jgi:hypothetical protein